MGGETCRHCYSGACCGHKTHASSNWLRLVALDLNLILVRLRLSDVVGCLQPYPSLRCRAEGFGETELRPSGSRQDTRTTLPGCGGFFMGMSVLPLSRTRIYDQKPILREWLGLASHSARSNSARAFASCRWPRISAFRRTTAKSPGVRVVRSPISGGASIAK